MRAFLLVPLISALFVLPIKAKEDAPKIQGSASEQTAPDVQKPQKYVDKILSDYRKGNYRGLLKAIDASYREKREKGEFNADLKERKKLSEMVTDHQGERESAFQKKVASLSKSQERELIEVCTNNPEEKISVEVRDTFFFSPSPEELKGLEYVHNLRSKFKGEGRTPLENALIKIDVEFWLKELSIGIELSQNKIDQGAFQEQDLVLQLEKMQEMENACQQDFADNKVGQRSALDHEIKLHITNAAKIWPKVRASAITRKYLDALGRGKAVPKSDAEAKMQVIVKKYLDEESALAEKYSKSAL